MRVPRPTAIAAAVGIVIVSLTAWLVSGLWFDSFHRVASAEYPVNFNGASWLRAQDSAPRAWFRMQLPVSAVPDSAVVWLDADQTYTLYVNGQSLGDDSGDLHSGRPAIAHGIDIAGNLRPGDNVIAVSVVNGDERPAAFRALVTTSTGGHTTTTTSMPGLWRATSDVKLALPRLNLHAATFSQLAYDAGQWEMPVTEAAPRGDATARVPQRVVEAPLAGNVLTADNSSTDIIVSRTLPADGAVDNLWLRLATPASYSILLNGEVVTSGHGVSDQGTVPLKIFNIGPLLTSSNELLAIRVTDDPRAVVYVDGFYYAPDGSIAQFASNASWQLSDVATPVGPVIKTAVSLGAPGQVFPRGTKQALLAPSAVHAPGLYAVVARLIVLAVLVLLWLGMAALAARRSRRSRFSAALVGALGMLPALFSVMALYQLSHVNAFEPPFPFTPVMFTAVAAIFAAGVALPLLSIGAVRERVRLSAWSVRNRWAPRRAASPRPASLPILARMRARWNAVSIFAMAIVGGGALAYQVGYDPYWQDELASVIAADGVRSHILPQLPSGFLYMKGELYSALIAIPGGLTGDDPRVLRGITVFLYVLCVIAFGFLLAPLVSRGSRLAQVGVTALFATAPQEIAWATDVRMYQLAQLCAIVFVFFLYRALRTNSTRAIVLAAVSMLAMYFAHEETFIFFPAVVVVFLAARRLTWIRDWRWWVFGGGAVAIVAAQYLFANLTHPPYFGFDQSNKPYVLFDISNFFWYFNVVFFRLGSSTATLAIISSLSVVGLVVGIVRRQYHRIYCGALLWITVLSLSTIFTPKIGRYMFVTLPLLFLLAGAGALDIIDGLRALVRRSLPSRPQARAALAAVMVATVPGFAYLLFSQTKGPIDYGLAAARLTGAQYTHQWVDYNYVLTYMRAHEQPGDYFISVAPADIATFYAKREPDAILSTGRNKLLYLMPKNGQAVDTDYGRPTILNLPQLQALMSQHHRIWLVTNPSYLGSIPGDISKYVVNNFDQVSQGASARLYLWQA